MTSEATRPFVHAPADRLRAWVALLFPFGGLALIFYALIKKGYSFLDYPELIASGELGWISQLIMWAALAIWIGRYSRPAWEAIRTSALISESEGVMRLADGQRVTLRDVIEIKSRNSILNKEVEFVQSNGRAVRQSLMFSSIPARLLITRLRERAP